ncbi:MAG: protein kinase [Muribaculaceae bacterium]|jgi:serine/threonine protein kinase|nr:protein kinase [Muribaculaceae bacterium]
MEAKRQTLSEGARLRSEAYTYKIEKVLGQGSFGITYLASTKIKVKTKISGPLGEIETEREDEMKVAIKEFFMKDYSNREASGVISEASNSEVVKDYRRKFRREAENLSKMHNEGNKENHIVKVIEVFDANQTCYYVMEYIAGETLDDYVKAHHGLQEAEALSCIRTIGEALASMHSQKMLHLDLKPKNVMRRSNGELLLIDFGLSKQYDKKGMPESSTDVGLGTPGYAPIEQSNMIAGQNFPATIDIYALGATLYKILTGEIPPLASEVLNKGRGLLNAEMQKHGVSESTKLLVCKAMSPLKAKRPQTVDEFLGMIGQEPGTGDWDTENGGDDDGGTVVVDGNDSDGITVIDGETDNGGNTAWWKNKYVVIAASCIVGILIAVGIVTLATGGVIANKDTVTATDSVKDKAFRAVDGTMYSYSGYVKNGKPNGEGKAVYSDNFVYEGNFVDGKRVDDVAKETTSSGDVYVGSFVNDSRVKGKYTSKSDGGYFEGIFKNDAPYDGIWYYANGDVYSRVTNGKEKLE